MGTDNEQIIQYVSGMTNNVSCKKDLYHRSNSKLKSERKIK